MVVRVILWPFGGLVAGLLIIGIVLLTVLVALLAPKVAVSDRG